MLNFGFRVKKSFTLKLMQYANFVLKFGERELLDEFEIVSRASERQRIHAALKRIAEGEYGYCIDFGEEIAPKPLTADPAIALCLDCLRG